ncbi:MAG: glycoside hydrolase family 15 protein, partial [Gemmatimonadales bacterium]
RQNTYSKVMCWVALDRLCRLNDAGHVKLPVDRYRRQQAEIRAAIETRGFDRTRSSYLAALDGDTVDASLLLLSRFGFDDAASDAMRGTYRRVVEELGAGPLLYRYCEPDGLPRGEGAFGICSFWAVSYLANAGDHERAATLFEQLLTYANDLGLFAEEIDPATSALLGNFPQAFTHVGLIDAALQLARARGTHPRPEAATPETLTSKQL